MTRVAPLAEPWPDWFKDDMARVMPPGTAPLTLFTSLATSRRAWEKFSAGSLLDKGPLPLREREIVIDRTSARCGCSYEWGIHAALFAGRAGLSAAQIADTASDMVDPSLWSDADLALLEATDALLDRKRLEETEFDHLRAHFFDAQILEIVQLVGFYHTVALICGTLSLPPEPGTPILPSTGV